MKKYFVLILAGVLGAHSVALASFEETSRRYLSGPEILWALSPFFNFNLNPHNSQLCAAINTSNSSYVGTDSPNTGEPVSPVPTEATVLWLTSCVEDFLSQPQDLTADSQRMQALLGPDAVKFLGPNPTQGLVQSWSSWSEDQKKILIKYMVNAFLGDDVVIEDFGFIKSPDDFRATLLQAANARQNPDILQIVTLLAENLCVRDEFLSY